MKNELREKLMRSYLLGDIKESEAASIEEEFFADDEKFEQMWEIENRLVDGYVRGRLSPEDRERFERHYMASPVHSERVAFAKNLIEKADTWAANETVREPKKSWLAGLAETLGLSPAPWRLAMAAATLLLATVSIWLFVDRASLRDEVSQLRADSEAQQRHQQSLSDKIAAAQSESERQEKEIERLRAERDAFEQQSQSQPHQPERRSILAFILSPINIRSTSDPKTLTIPNSTDIVRLRIRLPKDDAHRYQVRVRTVEGQQVWSQQVNRYPRNNSLLTIQIPADQLAMGDYFLTLSAVNQNGESDDVSRYFFRVIRQK